MKYIFRCLIFLTLIFPLIVLAQDVPLHPQALRADRMGFYEGDQPVTRAEFWQKVNSQPESAKLLARTERSLTVGLVMGSAGGLIMMFSDPIEFNIDLWGDGSSEKSSGGGKVIGGLMVITGGVVALTTIGGRSRAIDAYNRALFGPDEPVSFRLGLGPQGVGLNCTF